MVQIKILLKSMIYKNLNLILYVLYKKLDVTDFGATLCSELNSVEVRDT